VRWLLLAFVVVPLVELYLLVWIGARIGLLPTVAITLLTGLLGGALARHEGLRVWRAWQRALEQMTPPEAGVLDGVLVLLGGALLITPGVLTDVVGFALLLPWSRRMAARYVRAQIDRRLARSDAAILGGAFVPPTGSQRYGDPADRGAAARVVDTTGESVDRE
jgi:UPF0716 protein FxsA